MIRIIKCLKEKIYGVSDSFKIMFIYNIINITVAAIFYPLIPVILNYPPDSIDNAFQVAIDGVTYSQQYVILLSSAILVGAIFLLRALKSVRAWERLASKSDMEQLEQLSKLRRDCLNLPYKIYSVQILISSILISLVLILVRVSPILIFKISILIFSLFTLGAVVSLIFSKRVFKKVLINTFYEVDQEGIRIGIRNKIFLQVLPMFLVAVLFTSLIGYSRIIKEKGDIIFQDYKTKLLSRFDSDVVYVDISQINKRMTDFELKTEKDYIFIIAPNQETKLPLDKKLSKFFIMYMNDISPKYEGKVYDYYGVDAQGVFIKLKGNQGEWKVGVKYEVSSIGTIIFFLTSFIILFGLNAFVLSYFSKSLEDEISMVAKGLSDVAEGGDIEHSKPLPITSNDEIGDLVKAFNKIQELEATHIQEIKKASQELNEKNEELTALNEELAATNEQLADNMEQLNQTQHQLVESERLASLGQLIGGIAHNLKTPIMSIAGGAEALLDLSKELEEDTKAGTLEKQDYVEIAGEIKEWVKKIQDYQEYMSDIITAVKGQAVQLNASMIASFTLDELIKRVDILMKHELKRFYCVMDMDVHADANIQIKGEINNLVQIINNLISNAIQAYDEQGGKIDFIINKKDKFVEFVIKDYGRGIPEDIKDRLFKEMVTTKGKKGTGLGLYMSYSTIKGRFGGNMRFESEEGKGTTFYITIPTIEQGVKREVS